MSLLIQALDSIAQSFTNVASLQGLEVVPTGYLGNSVSFHDFDHDGWADVTMAVPGDSIRMYRNVDGTLLQLPSPAATPAANRYSSISSFTSSHLPLNRRKHNIVVTAIRLFPFSNGRFLIIK